jgi:hypothetical protein
VGGWERHSHPNVFNGSCSRGTRQGCKCFNHRCNIYGAKESEAPPTPSPSPSPSPLSSPSPLPYPQVLRNTVAPRLDGRNGFVFKIYLMHNSYVAHSKVWCRVCRVLCCECFVLFVLFTSASKWWLRGGHSCVLSCEVLECMRGGCSVLWLKQTGLQAQVHALTCACASVIYAAFR